MLGLGDTNYDKFCNMGKSIDKRLEELGGCRYLNIYCADEGTSNMEETIEEWKEVIAAKLKEFYDGGSEAAAATEEKNAADVTEALEKTTLEIAAVPST